MYDRGEYSGKFLNFAGYGMKSCILIGGLRR